MKKTMHISSDVLFPHPAAIGGLSGFCGLLAELSKTPDTSSRSVRWRGRGLTYE